MATQMAETTREVLKGRCAVRNYKERTHNDDVFAPLGRGKVADRSVDSISLLLSAIIMYVVKRRILHEPAHAKEVRGHKPMLEQEEHVACLKPVL